MFRYIAQRLVASIPVLIGILFVTFTLARVLPGDPCRAALGERATDELCNAYIKRFGLDRPIITQFGIYMNDMVHGDFGRSFRYGRPVMDLLIERLPVTLELTLAALTLSSVLGVLAGILSAIRRNSPIDVGTMLLANVGVSMPVFWLGLMLAYVFALLLKDTPFWLAPSGRNSPGMTIPSLVEAWHVTSTQGVGYSILQFLSNLHLFNALVTGNWAFFWDTVKHLILPAAALSTIPMSIIARMTRSSLLEVLGQDYIRTARAKGLREAVVVSRHAMRNALLPVVTVVGLSLGSLLGGAVLTETIFNFAGMGRLLFDAIQARDYTIVQSVTLVVAVVFVLVNLIVDLSYAFLDPRIRLS
ncbi:ABC transporter permease [Candidatus Amarolinea aalborgensis]|jgi:peptide/nickel transport system permease protein|uniref:ABC transporter permease n=1 Tax=Candidatus Amarolinea aalborgensis TaxID=2249329 RepID=UPI003BF96EEF